MHEVEETIKTTPRLIKRKLELDVFLSYRASSFVFIGLYGRVVDLSTHSMSEISNADFHSHKVGGWTKED
jgi:hypothetical protein